MSVTSDNQPQVIEAEDARPSWRLAVESRVVLAAGGLFVLFLALFAFVQFGTDALVGTDGYYHAKMGWLIRQEGLTPEFVWLPETILNEDAFYDHHLLYHAYLALFAGLDPAQSNPAADGGAALTRGAKWASIIMPSLAFLAVWWLLRRQGVRGAAVWAIGLFAVSEAFLYRMSMPRAQAASLLFLVLGLHWLLSRRYWPLLPLGFVFVWSYNGFPLLVAVGSIYLAATWLTERRLAWRAVVFPGVGIGLGLLLNPYFPENINFIVSHLLPKIGDLSTPVGNEWYPYQTWTLVNNSGFALLAFVLGVLALSWREKRITRPALTAFLLAILFGFMVFKSRRFIEYFPPFTLIFAALSISPLLEEWLDRSTRWARRRAFILPAALLLLFAVPLALTLRQARASVGGSKPADQYAEAAIWLGEHSRPGSMVFQTDWDDFPRLFFYDTGNIYTAGLDPTYLELQDKELYDEWVRISQGKVSAPGAIIRDRFKASYVFSDLNHDSFLRKAAEDPLLEEVYRDQYAVILAVVE